MPTPEIYPRVTPFQIYKYATVWCCLNAFWLMECLHIFMTSWIMTSFKVVQFVLYDCITGSRCFVIVTNAADRSTFV